MNIANRIYLMIYILVKEDNNSSRSSRTLFLVEMALGMFLAFFVFTLIGLFNIRNLYLSVSFGAITPFLLSWFISKKYYCDTGRGIKIIENEKNYTRSQKRIMAALALTILVFSFCLMFCGAILMSYIWSLHET